MQTDIKGRLAKIHLGSQRALWPVYEAVVNSIHAIEDRGGDGTVQIQIERDRELLSDLTASDDRTPISGFKIIDDGIGFNRANLASFRTADSRFKEQRGGKGIGRFTWLKAFERAEIKSSHAAGMIRFEFSIEHEDGVKILEEKHSNGPADGKCQTIVTLTGLSANYRQWISSEAAKIAQKILHHCLPFFLLKRAPRIAVIDSEYGENHDLNKIFKDQVPTDTATHEFQVGKHAFRISHARVFAKPIQPSVVSLCADSREVQQIGADKLVKALPQTLTDNSSGDYFYVGLVEGKYLDASNNAERGGFNFLDPDETPSLLEDLTKDQLLSAVAEQIRLYLHEPLQAETKKVKDRAETIIRNEMPECRTLIPRLGEHIEDLASMRGAKQLKEKINEIYFKDQTRVQDEAGKLIHGRNIVDIASARTQAERIITEVTGLTQDVLAKYVAYRKTIIELFESRICIGTDGSFQKESDVHGLFFPMKKTSEDVSYESHNLWLIDERMAFHEHLASDVGMPKRGKKPSPSDPRPDILVLNNIGLFGIDEVIQDGALVEFKKPEREDYTDKENPIQQIYRYVNELRSGKARAYTGRRFTVTDETRFVAFIIADVTPKLEQFVKDAGIFSTVEPKMRLVGYHKEHRVYIEILSLRKVLEDAKKRNRVLFRKLGLPV